MARSDENDATDFERLYGSIERILVRPPQARFLSILLGSGLVFVGAILVALAFRQASAGSLRTVFNVRRVLAAGLGMSFIVLPLHGVWKSRKDCVELRERGLVRRSASFGLKNLPYVEISRVERVERVTGGAIYLSGFLGLHRLHVHGVDGSFIPLMDLKVGLLDELTEKLSPRR